MTIDIILYLRVLMQYLYSKRIDGMYTLVTVLDPRVTDALVPCGLSAISTVTYVPSCIVVERWSNIKEPIRLNIITLTLA